MADVEFDEIGAMVWKTPEHPLSTLPPQEARWFLAFSAALAANTFSTLVGFLIL